MMKTTPWAHQLKEYEEALNLPARAQLWGMRTGKTKPILDQMCNHYLAGDLNGGIVLAPNGVHKNWTELEAPKHMWDEVSYTTLAWSSLRSNTKNYHELEELFLGHTGFKLFTINYQALKLERVQKFIKKFLKICQNKVYLVGDESHHLASWKTRQTKLAKSLGKHCKFKRLLSGTAVLNSPLQAYSQFDILEPGCLGYKTFTSFKDQYSVWTLKRARSKNRMYPVLDRYINLEEIQQKISKFSSVVLKSDVPDMPELIITKRICELSREQAKAYNAMRKYQLTINDDTISAKEGMGRLVKFQQILGGFVYNERGEAVNVDENTPRLDALVDEVMGSLPGKFIVWCRFTEDIRRVTKRLTKEGVKVVQFHGGISEVAREKMLKDFQNDPTVQGIIGQPKAGGEGRDFSKAEVIINYSHSHDAIIRNQSIERGTVKGGGSVTVVDLYSTGTVEEALLECLEKKERVADLVSGTGLQKLLRSTNLI